MPSIKEELVRRWADPEISLINRRLEALDALLFHSYEPSLSPGDPFAARFEAWLANVKSDNEKKLMFRLAASLFYIGPKEFIELYRFAYNGPIARWLIDEANIDVLSPHAATEMERAVRETWFCPITDSMRINSFFHINNIPAENNYRPDWRSLVCFGDENKIRAYMARYGLKRLVLLEDFVGGGSQVSGALCFADKFSPEVSTLVIPLIICPAGLDHLRGLEAASSLKIEPIVTVPVSEFVPAIPVNGEPSFYTELRDLALSTYNEVADGVPIGDDAPYHPLGYPDDAPTGGLVVMFSNTPDNTLPMIHWKSSQWTPLFPRHRRV